MGTGLSLGRWLCQPAEEARGPQPWHPSPSEAAPSYLTSAEALSRAASLRSLASTAPPSRCTHTSCGSLSTLCISSWCLPMHAAASCGGRVGHTSHLGPRLAAPGPARDGQPGLHPEGRALWKALQPARYLRPRQCIGVPQLLDAALQQLRCLPEAGREGMQFLRVGHTAGQWGRGGWASSGTGRQPAREEEEEQCQTRVGNTMGH